MFETHDDAQHNYFLFFEPFDVVVVTVSARRSTLISNIVYKCVATIHGVG